MATDFPAELLGLLAPPEAGQSARGMIGGYAVIGYVGAGGMGYVVEATLGGSEPFALKLMSPAMAGDPANRDRFLREAEAGRRFHHHRFVRICDIGSHRHPTQTGVELPYFTMPLLKGKTLAECLAESGGRFPPGEVARIGQEAAEGLRFLELHGLVHRDIKPANIFLNSEVLPTPIPGEHSAPNSLVFLDLGVHFDSQLPRLTVSGSTVLGTTAYAAPEVLSGKKPTSGADQFSLGVLLYEACTGGLPFPDNDPIASLGDKTSRLPPPPHRVAREVPQQLSRVIMRLLRPRPEERFPSADQLFAALTHCLHSLRGGLDPDQVLEPRLSLDHLPREGQERLIALAALWGRVPREHMRQLPEHACFVGLVATLHLVASYSAALDATIDKLGQFQDAPLRDPLNPLSLHEDAGLLLRDFRNRVHPLGLSMQHAPELLTLASEVKRGVDEFQAAASRVASARRLLERGAALGQADAEGARAEILQAVGSLHARLSEVSPRIHDLLHEAGCAVSLPLHEHMRESRP